MIKKINQDTITAWSKHNNLSIDKAELDLVNLIKSHCATHRVEPLKAQLKTLTDPAEVSKLNNKINEVIEDEATMYTISEVSFNDNKLLVTFSDGNNLTIDA